MAQGLWLSNLHALYEAILYRIDMLDHLVRHDVPGWITYDLMNVIHGSPVRIGLKAHRFDVRVDHPPLTRPVFAAPS